MKAAIVQAVLFVVVIIALTTIACKEPRDSDQKQRAQQETILAEATAQVGMPAITNFRERKLLKEIFELRDQANLSTFTYLVNLDGKLIFFCHSIGFGVPYATQFTNPEKPMWGQHGNFSLPQADPNGLFTPASADGTWVLCKDPSGVSVKPVFIEPRVIVAPFDMLAKPTVESP